MNRPTKIGLCGRISSGKTTVAKFLSQHWGYDFHSFGNGIRNCFNESVSPILGRGIDKTKDRKLLEYIGACGRDPAYYDKEFENWYVKEQGLENTNLFTIVDQWLIRKRNEIYPFSKPKDTDMFWIHLECRDFKRDDFIVIDDCRYWNEFNYLKDKDFIIIRLNVSKSIAAERARKRDGDFDMASFDTFVETQHLNFPVDIEINANKELGEVESEIIKKVFGI